VLLPPRLPVLAIFLEVASTSALLVGLVANEQSYWFSAPRLVSVSADVKQYSNWASRLALPAPSASSFGQGSWPSRMVIEVCS
jgi:hypothetical protein